MTNWPTKPYGWFSIEKALPYAAAAESFSSADAILAGESVIPNGGADVLSLSYPDSVLSVLNIAAAVDSYSFIDSDQIFDVSSPADSYSSPDFAITGIGHIEPFASSTFIGSIASTPVTFNPADSVFTSASTATVSSSVILRYDSNGTVETPAWAESLEFISLGGGGAGMPGPVFSINNGGGGGAGNWSIYEIIKSSSFDFAAGKKYPVVVGAGGVSGTTLDGHFTGLPPNHANNGMGQSAVHPTGVGELTWQHTAGIDDELVFVITTCLLSDLLSHSFTATCDGAPMDLIDISKGSGDNAALQALKSYMVTAVFSARIPHGGGVKTITVNSTVTEPTTTGLSLAHTVLGYSLSYGNVAGYKIHKMKPTLTDQYLTTLAQMVNVYPQANHVISICAVQSNVVPSWQTAQQVGRVVQGNHYLVLGETEGISVPGRNQDQTIQIRYNTGGGASNYLALEIEAAGGRGGRFGQETPVIGGSVVGGTPSVVVSTFSGTTYPPPPMVPGAGGVTVGAAGGVPGGGGAGTGGGIGGGAPGGSGGRGALWVRIAPKSAFSISATELAMLSSPSMGHTTGHCEVIEECPVEGFVYFPDWGWGPPLPDPEPELEEV